MADCEGADESLPYPSRFDAYYPATKAIAEKEILRVSSDNLFTYALRTHLIWGPGDLILPKLIGLRRRNRLRLIGSRDFMIDTIYVDNAADAHVRAFQVLQLRPDIVSDKTYFLSQDQPITIRAFINCLLRASGEQEVTSTINTRVALLLGWILERIYRFLPTEGEPPITVFIAKQMTSSQLEGYPADVCRICSNWSRREMQLYYCGRGDHGIHQEIPTKSSWVDLLRYWRRC